MPFGFVIGAQQIAIREMFDHMSPRIAPIVEDLAAENVTPDASVVVIAGLNEVIVTRHDGIDVFDFKAA